jgi:hypothetical protein
VANIPVPKLQMTIFQARYKTQLSHLGAILPAATQLEEGYPWWQTDGTIMVEMRDSDTASNITIDQTSFSYSGMTDNNDHENSQITKLKDTVAHHFKLKTVQRIGYRRKYIAPVKQRFSDLVTLFHAKTYNQSRGLLEALPEKLDDIHFRVDSSDGNYKYHITIGPMVKEQVPQFLRAEQERVFAPEDFAKRYLALQDACPEVFIYFDIDAYQAEEESIEALTPFVDNARTKISKIVTDFCHYIFSEQKG